MLLTVCGILLFGSPVTENLRLVKDGDSSAIVNNNPATAQRKVFLKRVSMNLSPAPAALVTANKAAIIRARSSI